MANTTNSMLNSLSQILETDGWDSMKEAGAELERLSIYGNTMKFCMKNQNGDRKTFQVVEVND